MFIVWHLNNAPARLPDVEHKVLPTDSAGPRISVGLDIADMAGGANPDLEFIFMRRLADNCADYGLPNRLPPLIQWADVMHMTITYAFGFVQR